MNEQLQNALAQLIGKTLEGIDASTAFLQAELPEVIEQLLMWYGVKSGVFFLIGIIGIVLLILVDKTIYTKFFKDNNVEDITLIYGLVGTLLRAMIYGVPLVFLNLEWLQIWIAPKIWLIEYAAKLAQ